MLSRFLPFFAYVAYFQSLSNFKVLSWCQLVNKQHTINTLCSATTSHNTTWRLLSHHTTYRHISFMYPDTLFFFVCFPHEYGPSLHCTFPRTTPKRASQTREDGLISSFVVVRSVTATLLGAAKTWHLSAATQEAWFHFTHSLYPFFGGFGKQLGNYQIKLGNYLVFFKV